MNFIKNFWQKRKKMILWATGIGCVLGLIFGIGIICLDVELHPMSYRMKFNDNFNIKYIITTAIILSVYFSLLLGFILNIIFLIMVKMYEIIKIYLIRSK